MSEAEKILARLVEWFDRGAEGYSEPEEELNAGLNIAADAKAHLAREKVYAEGWAQFSYSEVDGKREWYISAESQQDYLDLSNGDPYKIRVAVPACVLSPPAIEGEVVEDSEGRAS